MMVRADDDKLKPTGTHGSSSLSADMAKTNWTNEANDSKKALP